MRGRRPLRVPISSSLIELAVRDSAVKKTQLGQRMRACRPASYRSGCPRCNLGSNGNACDTVGVPNLTRSSGKHTGKFDLIRCLAPDKMEDKATTTEQRLTSIEGHHDGPPGTEMQLNDLNARMGNIE